MKRILVGLISCLLCATAVASDVTRDKNDPYHSYAHIFGRGPTVTLSPYLGLRSDYEGNDLIVNISSSHEELRLLKQRARLKKTFNSKGMQLPYTNHPVLEISGTVEAAINAYSRMNGQQRSDIDLSTVDISFLAEASDWAMGFLSVEYDNSKISGAARTSNSNVVIDRGFLTVGDLTRFPAYFSIGQMYVPFGRYSYSTIQSPFVKTLGRTTARAVLIGYSHNDFRASAYAFKGDVREQNESGNNIHEWGMSIGHTLHYGKSAFTVGADYIANIAESDGFHSTGAPAGFAGFTATPVLDGVMQHRVGGAAVNSQFAYGPVTLAAEYLTAVRHFDVADLSYNGGGAKPSALQATASYTFNILHKPSLIAFEYDRSFEALGVHLPRDSYRLQFNIALWKDTLQSLQISHDNNYHATDTAGGGGIAAASATAINGDRAENAVYIRTSIYF